ncbi:MAG: aminoglycoside phosphotransferase family protein [Candidatus Babeliales bacterium]|nr:aminoglycoside phosphotransferase family protein [Candidatus Babeliales bacterium]
MSSNSFERNNIDIWGDQGRSWLKALPSTVVALAKQWNLSNLKPIKNLSYNYVMTGIQGAMPIALKIGCDQYEMQKEMEVLNAYDGNSCIRLIESNMAHNAILLELAIPGTSLLSFFPDADDAAIEYTIAIMKSLHAMPIPSDVGVPTVRNWLKDLFEPPQVPHMYHIHKAQKIAERLLATQSTKDVLLHGDLHHGNILLSARGWLAIDPKGVIGEPAFEVCAFIRNPYPEQLKPKELLAHRIELFAQGLAIDKQRLHEWLYVRVVLDACWSINEGPYDVTKIWQEADQWEIV